ncbi:MAG: hypothetical protein Aurels2KO_03650 [Aureliella sp.]
MIDSSLLLPIGSAILGCAVVYISWLVTGILTARRSLPNDRYERLRIERLRGASSVFRWFEPLVEELKRWFPSYEPDQEFGLAHSLSNSPGLKHWTTQEFRATKAIEACLAGIAVFAIIAPTGFTTMAIVLALLCLAGYPVLARRAVCNEQRRRLKVLRLRMPMVVDQLALMMEAGGNFEESMRTITDEDASHPLNQELTKVLHEIDAGRTRREALLEFKERLPDADIGELVFAITKGEELGTPLSSILSDQAEQMRLKRSQWGEKAAAEAEVQIVFPGMLVMIACLIVIIAPILLPAAFNIFS